MKLTKKCFECGETFRKTELVDYAPPLAKTYHSYCPKCLEARQKRELFSNKVCTIFGIQKPGPRIWTERKRLIETYGYTDEIIVDCLEYLYNIKGIHSELESLYYVNPSSVNEMLKYKKNLERENVALANAIAQTQKAQEYVVCAKENTKKVKEWNPDDWLNID